MEYVFQFFATKNTFVSVCILYCSRQTLLYFKYAKLKSFPAKFVYVHLCKSVKKKSTHELQTLLYGRIIYYWKRFKVRTKQAETN